MKKISEKYKFYTEQYIEIYLTYFHKNNTRTNFIMNILTNAPNIWQNGGMNP